jgi:DNA-binding MurR/RpiR family transcriptional regulator
MILRRRPRHNGLAVQKFGLIEATATVEAHRRKPNSDKVIRRLQKFQDRFERLLEEQTGAIDETLEGVQEQKFARAME